MFDELLERSRRGNRGQSLESVLGNLVSQAISSPSFMTRYGSILAYLEHARTEAEEAAADGMLKQEQVSPIVTTITGLMDTMSANYKAYLERQKAELEDEDEDFDFEDELEEDQDENSSSENAVSASGEDPDFQLHTPRTNTAPAEQ